MLDTVIQSAWFLPAMVAVVAVVLLWGRVNPSAMLKWFKPAPRPPARSDVLARARWFAQGAELFCSHVEAQKHLNTLWSCCQPPYLTDGDAP